MNAPDLLQSAACRCTFSNRMDGEGCADSAPDLAAEYQRDAIAEAQAMRPEDETAEDIG